MKIYKGYVKNMELVAYHDLNNKPAFKMAMQVVDDRCYLYMSLYLHYGWSILDATNASKLELANFIPGPEFAETHQMSVAGEIMITPLQNLMPFRDCYQTSPKEVFYIWDIKGLVNPKRLGHWKTSIHPSCHRCHYSEDRYAHVAASCLGFDCRIHHIVDIIDTTCPIEFT